MIDRLTFETGLVNFLKQEIQPVLPARIEATPDSDERMTSLASHGAIFVQFDSLKVAQRAGPSLKQITVTAVVMVGSKNLRTHVGVYQMLALCEQAVQKYQDPENFIHSLALNSERYIGKSNGIWWYEQRYSVMTLGM